MAQRDFPFNSVEVTVVGVPVTGQRKALFHSGFQHLKDNVKNEKRLLKTCYVSLLNYSKI